MFSQVKSMFYFKLEMGMKPLYYLSFYDADEPGVPCKDLEFYSLKKARAEALSISELFTLASGVAHDWIIFDRNGNIVDAGTALPQITVTVIHTSIVERR